jgi:hypothetical protein
MQKRFISLGIFIALMSFSSGPALAGFQWVQPGQAGKDANLTPSPGGTDIPMEAPISVQPLPPSAPSVPPPAMHVLKAPPGAIPQTVNTPSSSQPPAQPVIHQPVPISTTPVQMAPGPQPLLKVKTIEPPAAMAPPPAPPVQASASVSSDSITWNPAPQNAVPAPAPADSAFVNESREYEARILDKPQQQPLPPPSIEEMKGAAESPLRRRKLVINPYPQGAAEAQAKIDTATPIAAPVMVPAIQPDVTAIPMNAPDMTTVVGFGSDMPLALALQQIAPQGYTFAFGVGVNPGTKVSWDGGNKPWMQVISDTIAPLGLQAQLNDKIVQISNVNAPAPEQHGSAHIPQKNTAHLAKDWNRGNITDPGEEIQAQPLSVPVSAQASAAVELEAQPLLPPDNKI